MPDPERARLDGDADAWQLWGPYVSERAWGTVREDYSPGGTAWEYLPHDHARSRAYRWSEDGLGGHLRPPPAALPRVRLLERARPDPQGADLRADRQRGQPRRGRQGVLVVPRLDPDPLLDALARTRTRRRSSPTPTSLAENRRRGREGPEYELLDTGVFDDDRYWDIERRLRQGRAGRRLHPCARAQRRPRRGDAPRAPDAVVPQHAGRGPTGWRSPGCGPARARSRSTRSGSAA